MDPSSDQSWGAKSSRARVLELLLASKARQKTRNSLVRSTRLLVARLELYSFYNESARFIMSQLDLTREP